MARNNRKARRERVSKIKDKKTDQLRNMKRQEKKASKLDDDKFFKREMKGLSFAQKQKMKRKRSQLIKREEQRRQRRDERNIPNRSSPDSGDVQNKDNNTKHSDYDKLARNPMENGRASTRKNSGKGLLKNRFGKKKIEPESELENHDNGTIDSKDVKLRGNMLSKMKGMRRRNKIKKGTKKAIKLFTAFPILIPIFLVITAIFVFFTTLVTGTIVSAMLSHPKAIIELHDMGFLGNALDMANVKDDVYADDDTLIARGIGDSARQGDLDWYGDIIEGGNKPKTPTPEGTGTKDNNSSGDFQGAEGSDNQTQIYNALRKLGWSHVGASGLMGNIFQESGYNPRLLQNGVGPGTGLFQWEDGYSGRWNQLEDWASKNNKDKWAVDVQLEYMMKECTEDSWQIGLFRTKYMNHGRTFSTGKEAFEYLMTKETDVTTVVMVFEEAFERAGIPNYTRRISAALENYEKFKAYA